MNSSGTIFEDLAAEYDRWFDEHREVYDAQVRILSSALPREGNGLEVGVGSGRFAGVLGIGSGIDPAREMLRMAYNRGIGVVQGRGEVLPFLSDSFEYVLMMTVICFVQDPVQILAEILRVLKPGKALVTGFIEKDGEIAMQYSHEKTKGRFLQYARFLTADEVADFYASAGYCGISVIVKSRGFCVVKGSKPPALSSPPF